MPSEKSARVSERKRQRNRVVRGATRRAAVTVAQALQKSDVQQTQGAILQAIRALDKAAQKGVLHANTAARKKSRLMGRLNALKARSTSP